MAGKVFLSHSSRDKALVRRICERLGVLRCEMDEYTFEAGLPNSNVILDAFDRCDIFALFASKDALTSRWVSQEIDEARRRLDVGALKRILVFCIDETGIDEMPDSLKDFAIYLALSSPGAIVQAIYRHLTTLDSARRQELATFVGRDEEVSALKDMLINAPGRPVGFVVSGLPGMGRAAIAIRVMQDLQPGLHRPSRVIDFHVFQSCADIALEIYSSVRDLISPDEVAKIRGDFTSDDPITCGGRLAEAIEEIKKQRQYVIFSDYGGIINNAGSFTNIVEALLSASRDGLKQSPLNFISRRRPLPHVRQANPDVAFLDVRPLTEQQASQFVKVRARELKVEFTPDELRQVIDLGRGVPQNLDFILNKCRQYPISTALGNVEDILQFHRERSRHLLADIELSDNASRLLAVIRSYFHVPAEFVNRLFDSYDTAAEACAELLDKHVATEAQGVFTISPPLWDAIDRDPRFSLTDDESLGIAKGFVAALNEYQADGVVPINVIDAGSVAAIVAGDVKGQWASHFIMPSHYIYLARRCYDRRQWLMAQDHASSALGYGSALTRAASIQAGRTLGMSAARLGNEQVVLRAVRFLQSLNDPYATGTAEFIRGFDFRLGGRFVEAERELLRARTRLRDDLAVQRELATVKLLAGNPNEALKYAEVALSQAPDSPFALDMVARARIQSARSIDDLDNDYELTEVMRKLERVTRGANLSLFSLRTAELHLKAGRLDLALEAANDAIAETPDLAPPYLMRARVHLAKNGDHAANRDLELTRERTSVAVGRLRHFESEVLRVRVQTAKKARDWPRAIQHYRRLEPFGLEDYSAIGADLAAAIDRDRRTKSPEVEAFAAKYRPT